MRNLPTDPVGVGSVFASMPSMTKSTVPCMNYAENVENEDATYSYADTHVLFLAVLLPLTTLTLTSMTTSGVTSQSCGNFDSNGGVMLRTFTIFIARLFFPIASIPSLPFRRFHSVDCLVTRLRLGSVLIQVSALISHLPHDRTIGGFHNF